MNVKKLVLPAVLSVFALSGAAQANMNINVDEKVKKMKQELALTEQQERDVRPILEEFKAKVEDAATTKEQRLNQVLTPDQINKLRDMKKKWDKD